MATTDAHDQFCLLLHIVPAYKVGGVELAAEQAAREGGGLLRTHFLASIPGLPVPQPCKWITARTAWGPLSFSATVRAVQEVYRRKPDVVVFSLWRSVGAFVAIRLLFPRKKLVVFLHLSKSVHWIDAITAHLMVWLANEVWADSARTLASRRVGNKPAKVISMLLHRSTRGATKRAPVGPTFVSWSRVNKQKRIDRALDFIGRIKKLRADVGYTIIGPDDGASLPELQAQTKRIRVEEQVKFVGAQDRRFILEAAESATFYLQLSDYEGQSMAVVEAMQLGLVPVVTPVGAIVDYCRDGVNAVFVTDLGEAAQNTAALLQDEARLADMSEMAQAQFASEQTYVEALLEAVGRSQSADAMDLQFEKITSRNCLARPPSMNSLTPNEPCEANGEEESSRSRDGPHAMNIS